jgi:hypothetical protein
MTAPKNLTLCVRPCLAAPGRWTVDYWLDGRPAAAYQAVPYTFGSREEARWNASRIQASRTATGDTVQFVEADVNTSRDSIPKPRETEDEIKKRLEGYVEKFYEAARGDMAESFFDLKKIAKFVGEFTTKSPLMLSLVTLVALAFHGREELMTTAVTSEFGIHATQLLAVAPILILFATLFAHTRRKQTSKKMARVREWVLQLAICYGWDCDRFVGILRKEFMGLDYAAIADKMANLEKSHLLSFTNLTQQVGARLEGKPGEKTEEFMKLLRLNDFTRKVQALAGMGEEPDFRAKDFAILPFQLLLSPFSLTPIVLGLLGATGHPPFSLDGVFASRAINERTALRGFWLGLLLILAIVLPALAWATWLSARLSPMLAIANAAASSLAIWLIVRRPLAIGWRHRLIPHGLELHECSGALLI